MRKPMLTAMAMALAAAACSPAAEQQAAGNDAANAANEVAAAPSGMAPADASGNMAAAHATMMGEAALAMMKQRHENFEKMGDAAKATTKALQSAAPDMTVIASSAATIAELAPKLPSWFPPGTGPEAGKTHAKAQVWEQPKEFAARHADFARAATAFDAAARGGDTAVIKTTFGDLGKSCKACHDKFRTEKK